MTLKEYSEGIYPGMFAAYHAAIFAILALTCAGSPSAAGESRNFTVAHTVSTTMMIRIKII